MRCQPALLVQQQLVADEFRVIGEQWLITGVRQCGGRAGQRLKDNQILFLFTVSILNFSSKISK
jgi:hypothetical protein